MLLSKRYSVQSLSSGDSEDPQGRIFMNDNGLTDLSDVSIVGASVDTIRQLFYGVPKSHFLEKLEKH